MNSRSGGWQPVKPTAAAAVPPTVRSWRRVSAKRLLIGWPLVMTRHTLRGRVVLAVAVDAVAHVQAPDLYDLRHALDVAVASRAVDAGFDVRLMREVDVVGHAVDALPGDRGLVRPDGAHLLDLGDAGADGRVAEHALLDVGVAGREALGGRAVAELAVDLGDVGVDRVV